MGTKNNLVLFFSVISLIILFTLLTPSTIYAESKASGSSAVLVMAETTPKEDHRVIVLRKFLEEYNSPLAQNAQTFIETADANNLDWKFVAAISGVESTFGHQIPSNSYNAWGWGIYGDNMIRFASFDEGIQTISQGLRQNYINRLGTDDVYAIGRMYAASPTWAQRVAHFMSKIDEFSLNNPTDTLSISL